jgi:hypothetical protein
MYYFGQMGPIGCTLVDYLKIFIIGMAGYEYMIKKRMNTSSIVSEIRVKPILEGSVIFKNVVLCIKKDSRIR